MPGHVRAYWVTFRALVAVPLGRRAGGGADRLRVEEQRRHQVRLPLLRDERLSHPGGGLRGQRFVLALELADALLELAARAVDAADALEPSLQLQMMLADLVRSAKDIRSRRLLVSVRPRPMFERLGMIHSRL